MSSPTSLPQPFIPFDDPNADLETVGGKGANLVKLSIGGFAVPNGFLIPTSVYRTFVESNGLDAVIAKTLQEAGDESDPKALEDASSAIRAAFSSCAVDGDLSSSLDAALRWLGPRPVAIRSSATAEDLPDLSFAGQQDTYLNVVGSADSARAVVDCWSSLWTARAIGYRSRNAIPHLGVALCVVVQEMVPAEASGVLFTANPLTGRRSEVVVDATFGLGEALVGGLVEPDHYVIEEEREEGEQWRGKILRKTLGSKAVQIRGIEGGGVSTDKEQECGQVEAITDNMILELARVGKEIEAYYGFPQDIEFAVIDGSVHILQSRPITSLYPLPSNISPEPLQVLFGFHLVQGVFEPFSPLGHTAIREVLLGGARRFGIKTTLAKQKGLLVSGMRVWINVSGFLRHPRARKMWLTAIKVIDPTVPQILSEVLADPRLAPNRSASVPWRLPLFFLGRIPRLLRCWIWPERMAKKTQAFLDDQVAKMAAGIRPTGNLALDFGHAAALLSSARDLFPDVVASVGFPAVVAGMVPLLRVLKRNSEEVADATGDDRFRTLYLEICKGLPNNVTTEMDLALWSGSQTVKGDADSFLVFGKLSAEELTARFADGSLPPVAQTVISNFLARYGCRGLGEIDIGRTRWSEDPEHIMGVLKSYMKIDDPALSPAAVFSRGAEEALRAAGELEAAARKLTFGFFKAMQVRWAVRRYRALGGLRESPKFFIIRSMGLIRAGLFASGTQMKEEGWLSKGDDLFYLEMTELETFAKEIDGWRLGDDAPESLSSLQTLIQERREMQARELRRKQIPRMMLSDGTAFYEGLRAADSAGDDPNTMVGDPVSPGAVEGVVRVVFNPLETQLLPGEILVCPGTDPAWTPLFLAAHGLIMECGGMMTHGSVVAREYGIPAVVGVHEATERLETGQRIRLDGSSGLIEIL